MIDVWSELSKVYNMKGIPDEAMSIIGDLMLAWSDEQDTISRYAVRSLVEAWCSEKKIVGGLLKMIDELPSQPTHETHSKALKSLDCIDRQSAIDAFKPYAEYESNRSNKDWVKRIEVILSELSSAQPEPINPCTICQEFDCTGCKFRRT